MIIGVNERLEIWDEVEFNTFLEKNEDNFANIAENLFDSGWQDA